MLPNHFWRDRPVFVTGCTGLVGAWLSAALVAQGADTIGLVRDRVGRSLFWRNGAAPRMTLVDGDVTDHALVSRVLAEYEIDTVIHLAAQTIVGIANRSPLSTFETNIKGTWVLLEAARHAPTVQRIVVASSDKAYGDQPQMPYTESAPLQGRHPYDVSKSAADLICLAYGHTFDLPVVITRCANLYGGGDLNWNRIVPGAIRSLVRGERPIIRSDGELQRDYMYVQDAVDAYLLAAQHADRPGIRGTAFNFGLNEPVTVRAIVEALIAIADRPDLPPIVRNEARNEIRVQYLDATRARQELAWQPRYTLHDGLRLTYDWYRDWLGAHT